jgi:hypothetical protein
MSKKTAKERVQAIHNCLAQNKKIKTTTELASILKISTVVPRMLKYENIIMYNAAGKIVWNNNIPYTLEMEERIYNKTLEYSKLSDAKCKEKAAERKAKAAAALVNDIIEPNAEEDVEKVKTVVSIEENYDLQLISSSIIRLHEKIDALTAKVFSLQIESKQRPRTKMVVTPSTNIPSKHNYFSEDL